MTDTYAMIDGASAGNPGKAGIGGFIMQKCVVIDLWSIKIGIATNNVAEYRALYECLLRARKHGIKSLKIFTDSELLVKQVTGEYRIKDEKLKKIYKKIEVLKREINFTIISIKREENRIADKLARLAIKE